MIESILHRLAALAATPAFQAVEFPKVDRNIDLSYKDWSSMPELIDFFKELGWWGAIALVAALVAHLAYKFLQRKDWAKLAELRTDQAREVLKIAEKERSKMEVAFSSGRSVPCAMLEATDQIVRLEAPDYANITTEFAGKEVQCFFRIRDPKGKTKFLFFNFTTRILGVQPRDGNDKLLSLASPTEMFQGQKRTSYRLAPPRNLILDFKAWSDSFSQAAVSQLPEPTFSFKPSAGVMRTFLSNISSGGLLLEVERNQLIRSSLPLETGKSWFIRLVVRDPVKEENLAWWLVARLVKVFENTNGRFELAFKFTAFGAGLKENRRVDWRIPRGEDGVPEISTWVFKRAVELVREGRSTD
jgi:hypothetical protein